MSTNPEAPATSRRDFLKGTCSALAALGLSGSMIVVGCDSGGSNDAPLPDGVTLEGTTLTVDLAAFPALTEPNGSLWVRQADAIIVNDPDVGYRAFSSICPHEREDVSIYESTGTGDYQLRCPAHDWTFDIDGDPTGRAQAGLDRLTLTKDGDTVRVTLDR
jgi:nitrite reductase/ring-hydroxylating ferredoxin subunit